MKKLYGALAVAAFLGVIGSVGAIEYETATLLRGAVQTAIFLLLFALFTWAAGGFDYERD